MRQRYPVDCSSMRLPAILLGLLRCSSATDVDRQAKLTTCELVRDFGYFCETVNATTEDGYVLEVDSVGAKGKENGTTSTDDAPHQSPILLVPGILAESGTWFVNFPSQSPGSLLADAGYDVWAMNTREIAFRCSNLKLKQEDDRYWQWSFDEIGCCDIAAVIDFVLNATGATKLPLLTYSQGFTASLVLLSKKPQYNAKIDILLGYAPVSNITYVRFPFPELVAISDLLFLLLDPLGDSGYLYLPSVPRAGAQLLCGILQGQPCSLILAITLLTSPEQLNNTRIPVVLRHYPIGTSYQNLRQFQQVYRAKKFVMYDYGYTENMNRYGQAKPPAYPLERISIPIALFSSNGDTLADPTDVADLVQRLGSRILFNKVLPQADFRHVDFIFGYRATSFLHQPMVATLNSSAEE